jgi:hypothetical protein
MKKRWILLAAVFVLVCVAGLIIPKIYESLADDQTIPSCKECYAEEIPSCDVCYIDGLLVGTIECQESVTSLAEDALTDFCNYPGVHCRPELYPEPIRYMITYSGFFHEDVQASRCGDQFCDPEFEDGTNCHEDCGWCGDGIRQFPYENSANCPLDGTCGDGICASSYENETNCPGDCQVATSTALSPNTIEISYDSAQMAELVQSDGGNTFYGAVYHGYLDLWPVQPVGNLTGDNPTNNIY